jgi:hypothetical protein
VALGSRAESGRVLQLPGNLGGTQGSGVLWVSDPLGIDWRVATSAIAIGHEGGSVSGLDHLVELLSVDEVFGRVHAVITTSVPGRVASPGLRLAGADDEAAAFTGALAVAIRRLTEPGSGLDGPFPGLLPSPADSATLDDGGELSCCRADVIDLVSAAADALVKLAGIGGMFRRGNVGVHDHLIEAGAALADLRNQVARLLRDANATGELTDHQRGRVLAAGVRFPAPAPTASGRESVPGASAQSPAYRTIADALREGDTLALVNRRLTLTERELKRHGSASYLPEVEQRCPSSLLGRLADPPQRPPRHASGGELRRELGLDEAANAANALADLVITVANREWSSAAAALGEVARIRIALDGVSKALTEHAAAVGDTDSAARGARLARLGEVLMPILGDLVLRVLAAESASPSAGGREAFEHSRDRAAGLLAEWTQHVQANGVLSQPSFAASFASSSVHHVPYAGEDDVAEIKEAIQYEPSQVMWQLCTPDDLSALDAAVLPQVVQFAPRLNRFVLAGAVPPETVWTSSGSYAGLLRLVPLRPGIASSSWASDAHLVDPWHVTEPS